MQTKAGVYLAGPAVRLEGAGVKFGADVVRAAMMHRIECTTEATAINGLAPLQDEEQPAHSILREARPVVRVRRQG
jgi:hypothetical protein